MRKILAVSSSMVPVLMFATTLVAQSPVPPRANQPGNAPSTEMPAGPGASGGAQQPAGAPTPGRSDAPATGQQRMPDASGGERAQGNEPTMKRQQGTTATEPQKPGTADNGAAPKPKQDAQRTEPGATTGNAQRQANEPGMKGAQKQPSPATEQRTTNVNITSDKQTTIRQTITRENITPVRDVNFSISVGVAVPRTVELRPLPTRVVEIVPQYRGYRFFVLADGRIVIVRPETYEIVYIITA